MVQQEGVGARVKQARETGSQTVGFERAKKCVVNTCKHLAGKKGIILMLVNINNTKLY